MVPRIRAAIKAGKPPLMFILEDPKHTDWTRWDMRLAKGYELYTDLMQGGVPIYWDRSERVEFETESYISKSKAVLDAADERDAKSNAKNYGKINYPVPMTIDGGPLPTLEEYLEEQKRQKEKAAGRGYNKFGNRGPFSNEAPALD